MAWNLPPFLLEEYLGAREFSGPIMFSGSDVETWSLKDLLALADDECRTAYESMTFKYTEPRGAIPLREEICTQYDLDISQILVCSGAEEAIYAALNSVLKPGDHAITVTPCYQSLESVPTLLCESSCIDLREEQGWRIDLDRVASAIKPNTKLLIINSPQNPTGSLVTQEEQRALIEMARAHGMYILWDEVYRLLEHNIQDRIPPIAQVYEKGISIGVMSKAYGLPGLRIGWIATRDQAIIENAFNIKNYLSICNSAPSEILSLIALRAKDHILDRNRKLVTANIEKLDQFMTMNKRFFSWIKPRGGCVGFVKFNHSHNCDWLGESLLKHRNLLILPGSIFGAYPNYFRISGGRANLPECIELLQSYVHEVLEPSGEGR